MPSRVRRGARSDCRFVALILIGGGSGGICRKYYEFVFVAILIVGVIVAVEIVIMIVGSEAIVGQTEIYLKMLFWVFLFASSDFRAAPVTMAPMATHAEDRMMGILVAGFQWVDRMDLG